MADNDFIKKLKFNPSGGDVSVDIMFGQAQLGTYTLNLFDSDGKNAQKIGEGNNIDSLPDVYTLSSESDLNKKVLGWNMIITAPASGEGQLYYARVTIMQDGKNLKDGPFEFSGPITDSKILMGWAEFVA